LTNGSWQRIELTEVIQHGATDAVFGNRFEFEITAGIEPVHGVDQSNSSNRDKVFEKHFWRASLTERLGDEFNLRQVTHDHLLAVEIGSSGNARHEWLLLSREA